MIGILAATATLFSLVADEHRTTNQELKELGYSDIDLLCIALMRKWGARVVRPNDLQRIQLSLGNGLVCPFGHPGPFQAIEVCTAEYNTTDAHWDYETDTLHIGSDAIWESHAGSPTFLMCRHKDHNPDDPDIFIVNELLDMMKIGG